MKRRTWKSRLTLLSVLVALSAALALAGHYYYTGWTPPRDEYPMQGVLVNAQNGEIIWPSVKALGADFAYIRATSGASRRDPRFAANRAGAIETGMRHGAVHRFSLCHRAAPQAANYVTTVPRDAAALPPVVAFAFEPECGDRPARSRVLSELNVLLNQIERHSGKPALLLLRDDFEDQYRISEGISRNIWLVGDFFAPDNSAKPWVMWTANRHYRIAGIEGPVEWSVVRS